MIANDHEVKRTRSAAMDQRDICNTGCNLHEGLSRCEYPCHTLQSVTS